MTTPTQNNVPSSTAIDARFNAEKLDEVVNSDNETYEDRFGNSRFTLKGLAAQVSGFFTSLASSLGGSKVGLSQGGTLEQTLRFYTPEQITGCSLTYDRAVDDSDYIQGIIDLVTSKATSVEGLFYQPIIIQLNRVYRITKQLEVNGNVVRFNSLSGAGFYFDPAGTFADNVCLKVTTDTINAAYQGHVSPIFSGLKFATTGRTLTLFNALMSSGTSPNNGSCLHGLTDCSFSGFNRIFTHGSGGWGWSWDRCQFSDCNNLMVITDANETYERHSFDQCIWQNSGYAFIINNADGKVYWKSGSFDYCSGAAQITAGHMEINSHMEWKARTLPFIEILGSNASVSVSGAMFIRGNTVSHYIFKQYQSKQVKIDNLYLNSDGTNIGMGLLSDKSLIKGTIFAQNDAAKGILYQSSDSDLLSGVTCFSAITLTETTYHAYSITGGVLTVTCTGSGVGGYLHIDIPCGSKEFYAYKIVASNTSNGIVYLEKRIVDSAKTTVRTDTSSGTTSWAAGSSSVTGGTVTLLSIPPGSSFVRLTFNLSAMTAGGTFVISSLKTMMF